MRYPTKGFIVCGAKKKASRKVAHALNKRSLDRERRKVRVEFEADDAD